MQVGVFSVCYRYRVSLLSVCCSCTIQSREEIEKRERRWEERSSWGCVSHDKEVSACARGTCACACECSPCLSVIWCMCGTCPWVQVACVRPKWVVVTLHVSKWPLGTRACEWVVTLQCMICFSRCIVHACVCLGGWDWVSGCADLWLELPSMYFWWFWLCITRVRVVIVIAVLYFLASSPGSSFVFYLAIYLCYWFFLFLLLFLLFFLFLLHDYAAAVAVASAMWQRSKNDEHRVWPRESCARAKKKAQRRRWCRYFYAQTISRQDKSWSVSHKKTCTNTGIYTKGSTKLSCFGKLSLKFWQRWHDFNFSQPNEKKINTTLL